jgi:hypothetical protein
MPEVGGGLFPQRPVGRSEWSDPKQCSSRVSARTVVLRTCLFPQAKLDIGPKFSHPDVTSGGVVVEILQREPVIFEKREAPGCMRDERGAGGVCSQRENDPHSTRTEMDSAGEIEYSDD